jgi:hypothetical protein
MAFWVLKTFFKPFNDIQETKLVENVLNQVSGGINTSEIDSYRQGVEITRVYYFFKGNGPKIWGGNIKHNGIVSHEKDLQIYGQTTDYTKFFGESKFNDNLRNFESLNFLLENTSYPFPIILNDGPQQAEEASIEPFTIPFRKQGNEPIYGIARKIKAFIDSGQNNPYTNGTYLINQFINISQEGVLRKFYDFGEQHFGEIIENSVKTPGYIPNTTTNFTPFNDETQKIKMKYVSLQATDPMYSVVSNLKSFKEDDNGILPANKKSKSAGADVYGPKQSIYGTDNLSFRNRLKGS